MSFCVFILGPMQIERKTSRKAVTLNNVRQKEKKNVGENGGFLAEEECSNLADNAGEITLQFNKTF